MELQTLIQRALEVRKNAYAPYSKYNVGAALLAEDGSVFVGCNFENVSFGLTICAERNAIGSMVAAGQTKLLELAVATRDGGTPCGACLQVLAEFAAPSCKVHCVRESGEVQSFTVADLIPHAFSTTL